MSVTGFYNGNVQVPVSQMLTGTGVTRIGDAMTDNTNTVASAAFCNDTGGAVVCQLRWFDAVNAVERLIWQGSVASKETKVLDNLPLRLTKGDEIRAAGANAVAVTVIYLVNFPLNRP